MQSRASIELRGLPVRKVNRADRKPKGRKWHCCAAMAGSQRGKARHTLWRSSREHNEYPPEQACWARSISYLKSISYGFISGFISYGFKHNKKVQFFSNSAAYFFEIVHTEITEGLRINCGKKLFLKFRACWPFRCHVPLLIFHFFKCFSVIQIYQDANLCSLKKLKLNFGI